MRLSYLSALSRSHFLVDFRQKWQRGNNPKSKIEFVRTTSYIYYLQKRHFGPKKGSWIAGIIAPYRKLGSRKTLVTSHQRFQTECRNMVCSRMRIEKYAIAYSLNLCPNRRNSRVFCGSMNTMVTQLWGSDVPRNVFLVFHNNINYTTKGNVVNRNFRENLLIHS